MAIKLIFHGKLCFALLYDCTIYDGSLFISTFKKLEQRDMMVEKEILFNMLARLGMLKQKILERVRRFKLK